MMDFQSYPGKKLHMRFKKFAATWLAVAIVMGSARSVSAAPINALETAQTKGNQSWVGNLGLDFNVTQQISVTRLGAFDDKGQGFSNGNATPITVGIWSFQLEQFVAQLTFPSGKAGSLENGYRFLTLPGAVFINPGIYSIIAHGFGNSDRNGNINNSGFAPLSDKTDSTVNFVGTGRYDGSGSFGFPPLTVGVQQPAYAGGPLPFAAGNFSFAATPEPGTIVVWSAIALCSGGYAGLRKRSRQRLVA